MFITVISVVSLQMPGWLYAFLWQNVTAQYTSQAANIFLSVFNSEYGWTALSYHFYQPFVSLSKLKLKDIFVQCYFLLCLVLLQLE